MNQSTGADLKGAFLLTISPRCARQKAPAERLCSGCSSARGLFV